MATAKTKVKICGITNLEDALFAAQCGADALGFVFWKDSKRYIAPENAARIARGLPPFISKVGVFVNDSKDGIKRISEEVGLGCLQLHGDEEPEFCSSLSVEVALGVIKAIRVKDAGDISSISRYEGSGISAILLDTFVEDTRGGTGKSFDWGLATEAGSFGTLILSGGLNPGNVRDAIGVLRPYAVDVSSGVEQSPGKKDHEKVVKFIRAVKDD